MRGSGKVSAYSETVNEALERGAVGPAIEGSWHEVLRAQLHLAHPELAELVETPAPIREQVPPRAEREAKERAGLTRWKRRPK